jgi:uroporphyrinogen-III decarboxylase
MNKDENDLDRFTTCEEKKLLKILESKLPMLLYWDLMHMFNRFIAEMIKNEKKVEAIADDVTDMVIKANQLFNKLDHF